MNTITKVRQAFWEAHPQIQHMRRAWKSQNDYITDIRVMFVEYIDTLRRDEIITEHLAQRATL